MTIATDRVDSEAIARPQRWDVQFIRRFMFRYGLLSSVFDFLTFAVLYFVLKASPELFRSGWFVESVVSAALVVLVLRTRGAFWRSRPSMTLALAPLAVIWVVLNSLIGTWCERQLPSPRLSSTVFGPVQPSGVRRAIIGQRGRGGDCPTARDRACR